MCQQTFFNNKSIFIGLDRKNKPMSWLQYSYATQLPQSLFAQQAPVAVRNPNMILFNEALADELGVARYLSNEDKRLAYLSGNEIIEGGKPIAQAYAGHQFGHFTKLGDGRAILLGEIETSNGLYDLQLKGSGQTPYSRRGDGRATYYSMLREYLISEAMHGLGIPTTRSLAVVKTGETVFREVPHEGAILSRVAASHIRVGTFEYARFLGKDRDLEALLSYTIHRHYPDLKNSPNPALALLEKVMQKQKELILHWMRVGFIHGVMNTDNMTISGETIDYGPCAFMNAYDPSTVFSSIDSQGRYAFANQPNMAYWNLTVFANAILPLINKEQKVAAGKAQDILDQFPKLFAKGYFNMMSDKFGITHPTAEDRELIDKGLKMLQKYEVDYTNFFIGLRQGGILIDRLLKNEDFQNWFAQWELAQLRGATLAESSALMAKTNPVVIPRNHLVENVLDAAISGDMNPFQELLKKLASPYDDSWALQEVPKKFDEAYQTFCGT